MWRTFWPMSFFRASAASMRACCALIFSPAVAVSIVPTNRCPLPERSGRGFFLWPSRTVMHSPNKKSNPLKETGNDREKKEYYRIGEQGNGACNSERYNNRVYGRFCELKSMTMGEVVCGGYCQKH